MRQKSFTLIELLVVIAIIGLLISIVLASISVARDKAKIAKTRADMDTFKKTIMMYAVDNDKYPCEGHYCPSGWYSWCNGLNPSSCLTSALSPYLPSGFPTADPWGTQYVWHYHPGTTECTFLTSVGPDKAPNDLEGSETNCLTSGDNISSFFGKPGP